MTPNPYILLSLLLPYWKWYSALDLKDAFCSLPLSTRSQDYFAFEWCDPKINGHSPGPACTKAIRIHPSFLMKICMRTWANIGLPTQT